MPTDDQPNTSSELTTSENRHIFPFFKLARELRDLIYIQSLTTQLCYTHEGYRLEAFGVPATHALLISKQFSSEYLETSQDYSSLIISECTPKPTLVDDDDVETTWDVLPRPATLIPRVTFVVDCKKDGELDGKEGWVNRFLCEMSGARMLSLQFPLAVGVKVGGVERTLMWSDYWTRLPGLRDLGVWRVKRRKDGRFLEKTRLLTWDGEKKAFRQEVKEIEEEGKGNVSDEVLRRRRLEAYAFLRYG